MLNEQSICPSLHSKVGRSLPWGWRVSGSVGRVSLTISNIEIVTKNYSRHFIAWMGSARQPQKIPTSPYVIQTATLSSMAPQPMQWPVQGQDVIKIVEPEKTCQIKHRKNCECCPGHHLIVNHFSSMSWFKFRNLSVTVNCVTKSLIH